MKFLKMEFTCEKLDEAENEINVSEIEKKITKMQSIEVQLKNTLM